MRYGLFSDVHSNLEALRAVLGELKREEIDKYLCLGDIVGYGARPNQVIDLLKKLKTLTAVAGNHDWDAAGKTDITELYPIVKEATLWTQRELTKENKDFLGNLPLTEEIDNFIMVHGSLYSPEQWHYILTLQDAVKNFDHLTKKICFIGHSHRPAVIAQDKDGYCEEIKKTKVFPEEDYRYLVNVGSVGQPRDGNPKAAYCLYDDSKKEIEIKRVPYQIKKVQEQIIAAGLPQKLAHRLATGS
jgi:predicted phosphodiesterase